MNTVIINCLGEQFLSRAMHFKEEGGRLLSISASPAEEGETQLNYFFDLEDKLQVLAALTRDGDMDSLYSLFPSADFMEREIYELYGVKFMGHPNLIKAATTRKPPRAAPLPRSKAQEPVE